MSYIRKLPSGKWQATVRDRSGERHSTTDQLKSVVKRWAAQQEAAIARGDFRDPRLGEVRIGDWHERVTRVRGIEAVTKVKNASLWRTHCEPEWAKWPMSAVTRLEAQEWVNRLASTRRARHQGRAVDDDDQDVPLLSASTIADIVHVMSSLYRLAMREHPPLVVTNPFADLELPEIGPRPVEFYERAEAGALYEAAGEWRTLIELGMDVGLRPGELYGLHGHRVDWLRPADGGRRDDPPGPAAAPEVHEVSPRGAGTHHDAGGHGGADGRPPARLTGVHRAEGGPVTDGHFRNRVWYPAIEAAGIRRFPPRIMRHTAASWLVQDGVPLYDVQALLGHEDYATT
jgi:integrase